MARLRLLIRFMVSEPEFDEIFSEIFSQYLVNSEEHFHLTDRGERKSKTETKNLRSERLVTHQGVDAYFAA